MVIYSKGKIIWTNKQQKGWYFKLNCWLSYKKWYQILLIPYHIIAGYYYKYSTKEIYKFCKEIFRDLNYIENKSKEISNYVDDEIYKQLDKK